MNAMSDRVLDGQIKAQEKKLRAAGKQDSPYKKKISDYLADLKKEKVKRKK